MTDEQKRTSKSVEEPPESMLMEFPGPVVDYGWIPVLGLLVVFLAVFTILWWT